MRHFSSSTTKKCYGRDTSSLLLPRYKMVALERWSGLGGGGGVVRDEALRRSSKEATFSEPFYLLKGTQYRIYKIFLKVESTLRG